MRLVPGCGRFQDVSDSRRGQCCRMWKVLFFGTRQNWAVSRIWARRRRNRSRSSHFQGCSSFHDLAVSSMWHFPGCGAPQDFVFSGCRILQPVVISRICSLTEFGLFQDLALPSMRAARRRKGIQDASVAFSRMWHFPGPGSFQDLAFSRMWHSPVCGILQDVTLPRICYPVLSRVIPQDATISSMHFVPGCGRPPGQHSRRWAARRRKRSVFQDVAFSRICSVTVSAFHISRMWQAIKRPRTRSTAARQVSNTHERDLVTNQNV